ncbi:MAG TPA: GNAT family N-acetyltransferase [Alphaproteobacteria bacterium]
MTFKRATTQSDLARCAWLRGLVFGAGQNVPINEDIDDLEDQCRHIIGFDKDVPCATARWRIYKPGIAKIERVAVSPNAQGKGIGKQLMQAIIDDIRTTDPSLTTFRLGSQDHAIPFYERLGFSVVGDGFMDANIPHHWMERAA